MHTVGQGSVLKRSHLRLGPESNSDLGGGMRECDHSPTVASYLCY